ncbi:uncharacterized protein LOC120077591 [Benincasa hispida]|uniref:uncharacterized protein LOC120077591 n=1 Tax=Benincasa hispida TaxID=102211 RepID=UPI0018FFD98B|nr:uncharacterized protein LOC120077591 [Benincasa hispida]
MSTRTDPEFEANPEIDHTFRTRAHQNRAWRRRINMADNNNNEAPEGNQGVNRPVQDPVFLAADHNIPIRNYAAPNLYDFSPGISRPIVEENARFEIKPVMVQMIQNMRQFESLQCENPHAHLTIFVEMCSTFSIPGITPVGIRLYLFPYTLRDKAKRWAHSLEANEITSSDQLVEWFMKKFFPPAINTRRRKNVLNFEKMDNETLSTAWVRFRRLVKNCPHIGILDCVLMEMFYNGLNRSTQAVADASAVERFMDKTYTKAKVILDRISWNMDDWVDDGYRGRGSERRRNDNAIVFANTMTTLATQMAMVTSLLQLMALNQGVHSQGSTQPNAPTQVAVISYIQYGKGHAVEMCPSNRQKVCVIQNNPYNNTYNPDWRNHPNFGWG